MTKKTLTWRLKDLPDAVDVAELVDKKVITPEEARDLLFNDKKDDTVKLKELEEEIKFLRELCDTLAKKTNGGWTTVVHEYRDYRPKFGNWYGAYGGVINTLTAAPTSANLKATAGTAINANYITSSITPKGLSSLNK